MKPTTRIAIANLLATTGAVLHALADEFGRPTPAEATDTPATPEPTKKPKKEKAAAAPVETPAEPEASAEPEKPAETKPAANGEITNPDYARLRALIDPLIKGGQGPDVKAIIQKYAPDGGLKVMEPRHHAAFEKDIAALSY